MHFFRCCLVVLLLVSLPAVCRAGLGDYLDGCPATLPPAQIRVVIDMYDPPVNNTYSIGELSRIPTSPSPYASDAIAHTYGLTKNPLVFLLESQIASGLNPLSRKKCYWYHAVTLRMQLKPEIYMGKEIRKGTCYFNAVLRHELEHANIERRLLADYQPIITKTITDFVNQTGFMRNIDEGNDQKVYDHLKGALGLQMDTIHSHMEPVRKARQAQIDTVASYESTAAPCRASEQRPY